MNRDKPRPLIGILAGGSSDGMGVDKALLMLGEESLLERAVRTALETGCPIAVSGHERPEDWPFEDVQFVPDEIPFQGPLHGISLLLEQFRCPVMAIGCDMPLLTTDTLEWLISHVPDNMQKDGLATVDSGGGIQPLFSIYTPQVLSLIERQRGRGDNSVWAVIDSGRFGIVAIPPELEPGLLSVDTPGEFEDLKEFLDRNASDSGEAG